MPHKPTTAQGYQPEQLARVRATCLYVATKLGDLLDQVVVVGGLVPALLVDQSCLPSSDQQHVGTLARWIWMWAWRWRSLTAAVTSS